MQRSCWNFNYQWQACYCGSVQVLCFAKNKTSSQLWLQHALLLSHLSRGLWNKIRKKSAPKQHEALWSTRCGASYSLAVQGFQLAQLVSRLPLSHLQGFKQGNFNGVERFWEICVFRAFIFHSGLYTLNCLPKTIALFYHCVWYLLIFCIWLKFVNMG